MQYKDYDSKEWEEKDIETHKNTDWASRNYKELPVENDSFESTVVLYSLNEDPKYKTVKFIKYIRSNPIFPPYYAPENKDNLFDNAAGPMFDGNKRDKYDIHDRYETFDLYNMLSESIDFIDNRKNSIINNDASMDPGFDEFDITEDENMYKVTLNSINGEKTFEVSANSQKEAIDKAVELIDDSFIIDYYDIYDILNNDETAEEYIKTNYIQETPKGYVQVLKVEQIDDLNEAKLTKDDKIALSYLDTLEESKKSLNEGTSNFAFDNVCIVVTDEDYEIGNVPKINDIPRNNNRDYPSYELIDYNDDLDLYVIVLTVGYYSGACIDYIKEDEPDYLIDYYNICESQLGWVYYDLNENSFLDENDSPISIEEVVNDIYKEFNPEYNLSKDTIKKCVEEYKNDLIKIGKINPTSPSWHQPHLYNYFEDEKVINEVIKDKEQEELKLIKQRLDQIKKEYGYKEYDVSAKFSNGETLYSPVDESLKSFNESTTSLIDTLSKRYSGKDGYNAVKDVLYNIAGNGGSEVIKKAARGYGIEESLDEDYNEYINESLYLFPPLTEEDINMLKAYNLKFSGKNNGPYNDEDNYVVVGSKENLEKYAKNYLGYELHPDYFYDNEEDFAGEIIITESNNLKEDYDPYIIYKELGKFKGTPKSNFDSRIQNAKLVRDLSNFESVKDIKDYFYKYGLIKNEDEIIVDKSAREFNEKIDPEISKNWVRFDKDGTIATTNNKGENLIYYDDAGLNADIFHWSVVDKDGDELLNTGRLYYGSDVSHTDPLEINPNGRPGKIYGDMIMLKCISNYYKFNDDEILEFLKNLPYQTEYNRYLAVLNKPNSSSWKNPDKIKSALLNAKRDKIINSW